MRLIPLVALALLGCPKTAPEAAVEPIRYTISQVPFKDLCISPIAGAGPVKAKDQEHLTRALGFFEEGRAGFALTAIAQVEEKTHPRVESYRSIGLLMSGRADESEVILGRLIEAHPQDSCLHMAGALVTAAMGKFDVAVPRAERAWELDPTDSDAALLWASLRGNANIDDAIGSTETVFKAFPENPAAGWLYGLTLLDHGRADEALAPLEVARSGNMPVDQVLTQVAFANRQMDTYLTHVAKTEVPLIDRDAIATSEEPLAVYYKSLGMAEGDALHATLHTSMGDLKCTLYPAVAPVTVSNFVGLATGVLPWTDPNTNAPGEGALYTDITFHRVIPDFMVQVGDPLGNGTGGPGYMFRDEPVAGLGFDKPGLLAMANSGPATNGSQFFVTEAPTPHLNGKHTIFGECDSDALALIKKITRVPAKSNRPLEPVLLKSVEIFTVAAPPAPEPEPVPSSEAEPATEAPPSP